jgi:hypothetical protein
VAAISAATGAPRSRNVPSSSSPASIRPRNPVVLAPTMQTIMPTARDTRRGAPLFPGPPTDASRETWPRWLGVNLWLFACVPMAVGAALVAISAVAGGNDGDDAPWIA